VEFAAYRQSQGLRVSTVNSSLRVLRRMLRLAVEWGELQSAPTIKRLPGERHRERVVSYEEESRYLGTGSELLASIVTLLVDTGMRPEECYRLRWESITWVNGRNGTLLVTHGKTAAARRLLPMTPRVRAILESRWELTGRPLEAGYGLRRLGPVGMSNRPASRASTGRLCVWLAFVHSFCTASVTRS
jgi:integrase